MAEQETEKKKLGGVRLLVGAGALTALLYAGDKLDVAKRVSDGYNSSKAWLVDIFTKDVGEASSELVEKIQESKVVDKYKNELGNVAYEAVKDMPYNNKKSTIMKIVKESKDKMKKDLFRELGDLVEYGTRKEFIMDGTRELRLEDKKDVYELSKSYIDKAKKLERQAKYYKIWKDVKEFPGKLYDKTKKVIKK